MASSKHPKRGQDRGGMGQSMPRPPDDLKRDPGIGASKGSFGQGTDPAAIAGENTTEGDVMNDATPQGSVSPNQRGRTNR